MNNISNENQMNKSSNIKQKLNNNFKKNSKNIENSKNLKNSKNIENLKNSKNIKNIENLKKSKNIKNKKVEQVQKAFENVFIKNQKNFKQNSLQNKPKNMKQICQDLINEETIENLILKEKDTIQIYQGIVEQNFRKNFYNKWIELIEFISINYSVFFLENITGSLFQLAQILKNTMKNFEINVANLFSPLLTNGLTVGKYLFNEILYSDLISDPSLCKKNQDNKNIFNNEIFISVQQNILNLYEEMNIIMWSSILYFLQRYQKKNFYLSKNKDDIFNDAQDFMIKGLKWNQFTPSLSNSLNISQNMNQNTSKQNLDYLQYIAEISNELIVIMDLKQPIFTLNEMNQNQLKKIEQIQKNFTPIFEKNNYDNIKSSFSSYQNFFKNIQDYENILLNYYNQIIKTNIGSTSENIINQRKNFMEKVKYDLKNKITLFWIMLIPILQPNLFSTFIPNIKENNPLLKNTLYNQFSGFLNFGFQWMFIQFLQKKLKNVGYIDPIFYTVFENIYNLNIQQIYSYLSQIFTNNYLTVQEPLCSQSIQNMYS